MPATQPYRLSIAPDLEQFRPEIEHACLFLERCHFVARANESDTVLHYGANPLPGAIHVPAALFPHGVRVDARGIHPNRDALHAIEAGNGPAALFPGPVSSSPPDDRRLTYDALGFIFFMLSRIEERGSPERDRYGRFPYDAALVVRRHRAAAALADDAARDLACALTAENQPRNRTNYRVILTHDVDRLHGYHRPLEPLRQALGDIARRGRIDGAMRRLTDAYFAEAPWRSIRALMAASESTGHTSHFFFMGPSRDHMDSPYALRSPDLLRRIAHEIRDRGHGLGFHPGFQTAGNEKEWRKQRHGLEAIIGQPVREGRQHVLCYSPERTPDIWDDAGMMTDFTLAWPETPGFRNGTCRAHQAYSLVRRRTLKLEQVATAIMDFGLFGGKYRDLSIDDAMAECLPVIDTCRRFGGTLAILYHTGQTKPPHALFYDRLLETL